MIYHLNYSAPPPQIKTSGHHLPPLPQRSPRIRRRHKLHNYASLASTNRSFEERSSVGALPLNSSTTVHMGTFLQKTQAGSSNSSKNSVSASLSPYRNQLGYFHDLGTRFKGGRRLPFCAMNYSDPLQIPNNY